MKTTTKILFYSIIIGLFAIPFIAFIVANGLYFPFIAGKGFTFRILVEVLFGLYLLLAAIAPEYRPRKSWITISILIFVAATFVADLFSANVYKSFWSNYERMEGFVLIAHLLLYYIVASSVLHTKALWKKLFNVSIATSVVMSGYGVLQLLGKIAVDQGGVRLDATFGNATYLAIYLVFNIFFCLYFLADRHLPTWQKWVYWAAALFEGIILYYTATRGAILGLIGGLVIAAILVARKEKENRILRKAAVWFVVIVVVLSGIFLLLRNASFVQKSPVLSRFASISVSDLESQGRYYVWPMAVKGFLQSPKTFIIGWGQESFNFVFNKYYDPHMYGQEEWFDRAHDIVLDWLINGGIVGLLAYLSMFVGLLYVLWKKTKLSTLEKSLLIGLIVGYFFNNIFVFDNLISYILFFSVLAYVHAVSVEGEPHPTTSFYTRQVSSVTFNGIWVPAVVIGIGLIVYFVNVPALLANVTLIQAMSSQSGGVEQNLALFKKAYSYNSFGNSEITEQLLTIAGEIESNSSVDATSKQDFYNFGRQQILAKIAQTPTDARYLVFAGHFFNQFGDYDNAITYLKQALVQSPKKVSIFFELASSYLGKGDSATAFQLFQEGYNLVPDNQEAQIIYAVGAIYTRNNAAAEQILQQIPQSTFITDDRFVSAFAAVGNYPEVITILNARLTANPGDPQTMLSLAAAYAQSGNKSKAIDIINQIIAAHPEFQSQGEQYIQQIQSQ